METEIKIKIPEGMEIDKENSTFECIKFRPKKITYADISSSMPSKTSVICTIPKHYQKCITFAKLLEVAEYLNGNWKPDWNDKAEAKFFILYNHKHKELHVWACNYINSGEIYFSSEENAKKAIEIIGEEELKQFFS